MVVICVATRELWGLSTSQGRMWTQGSPKSQVMHAWVKSGEEICQQFVFALDLCDGATPSCDS